MNTLTPFVLFLIACLAGCAGARTADDADATPRIVTEEVRYRAGDADCVGWLAYDANRAGPRPGVLVVHEWWGHNDYVRRRAEMLAQLGYTALALDMYGDGKRAAHPEDAQQFAREVMGNMAAGVARFEAARTLLEAHPSTDPERTAAIGYCFGGAIVLAMARRGADLDAVASFHGSLATDSPAQQGAVKSQVLICHGAKDALVPLADLQAAEEELMVGGAPLVETLILNDAQHGFTNPDATALGERFGLPLAYDAKADQMSWDALQEFLAEAFR